MGWQNRLDRLQDDPMIGRKNNGGQPYNVVNHRYDDNLDGKRLQYHDDMVKYRADVRSTHLAARQHLGFNPITGEQTVELRAPRKPEPDTALKGFFGGVPQRVQERACVFEPCIAARPRLRIRTRQGKGSKDMLFCTERTSAVECRTSERSDGLLNLGLVRVFSPLANAEDWGV